MAEHEVIVVGGGTTGAACAFHLCEAGVRRVLVLDMGVPGRGSDATAAVRDPSGLKNGDEHQYIPFGSGSNVFANNKYYRAIRWCNGMSSLNLI